MSIKLDMMSDHERIRERKLPHQSNMTQVGGPIEPDCSGNPLEGEKSLLDINFLTADDSCIKTKQKHNW